MSSDPTSLLFAFFGAGGGCVWFYRAFAKLREKQLIRDIPTSKIQTMAMGLVEIQGAAKKIPLLGAPISGQQCVHYKLVLSELVSSGKSSHWEVLSTEISPELFEIDDGTGKALVDPAGADFEFEIMSYSFEGHTNSMTATCKLYLEGKGISTGNGILGGIFGVKYKVEEWSIPPEQPLFVLGSAAPPPETAAGPETPRALIQRDPNSKFYVISEGSQKDLLRQLDRSIWLGLVCGPLLAVASLGYILITFMN